MTPMDMIIWGSIIALAVGAITIVGLEILGFFNEITDTSKVAFIMYSSIISLVTFGVLEQSLEAGKGAAVLLCISIVWLTSYS